MTTAHRPTFDHLKGKLNHNKTHITHKRFLPLHTQLKYRQSIINQDDDQYEVSNIDLNELKKSVEELKLELIQKEQEHFKEKDVEYKDRYLSDRLIESGDNFEERRQKILEDTKDIDGSSASESDNDESESESDSSDEDEMLLQELSKLKKLKQDNDKLIKKQILSDNITKNQEVKKSWRSETVFTNRNKRKHQDNDDEFINDLLRSEFHKKFMNKYIK